MENFSKKPSSSEQKTRSSEQKTRSSEHNRSLEHHRSKDQSWSDTTGSELEGLGSIRPRSSTPKPGSSGHRRSRTHHRSDAKRNRDRRRDQDESRKKSSKDKPERSERAPTASPSRSSRSGKAPGDSRSSRSGPTSGGGSRSSRSGPQTSGASHEPETPSVPATGTKRVHSASHTGLTPDEKAINPGNLNKEIIKNSKGNISFFVKCEKDNSNAIKAAAIQAQKEALRNFRFEAQKTYKDPNPVTGTPTQLAELSELEISTIAERMNRTILAPDFDQEFKDLEDVIESAETAPTSNWADDDPLTGANAMEVVEETNANATDATAPRAMAMEPTTKGAVAAKTVETEATPLKAAAQKETGTKPRQPEANPQEVTPRQKEAGPLEQPKEMEVDGDEQPPSKKGRYVTAAEKAAKPRCHAVLSVHSGLRERGPITQEDWTQIFGSINRKIATACCLPGWNPRDRIEWATWAKDRGLVACTTDEMVDLVINVVKDLGVNGQSFKAWKSGEKMWDDLCTLIIQKEVSEYFADNDIITILMAQNGLKGSGDHGEPIFTNLAKGFRRVTIGVSQTMGDEMRSLGGLAGIGAFTIKVHIKRKQ